ncbi:hypothetical protein GCM10018780_63440 [Streptomyces lanatus]|nr:hypothetical protein GCM10018780_63440 [Streptomyces lanatus]
MHGRGGQAQDRAEACGAELAVLAQPAHPGLHRCRRAMGCRAGAAGAVVQALLALRPPAAHPFVGCDARDAHFRGDVRDGSATADTFDQQPPAMNGQPGITVGHEDLRAVQS